MKIRPLSHAVNWISVFSECSAAQVVQLASVAAGGGQLWVKDEINVCLKSM